MIGIYNYTVYLTYLNLLSGVTGIYLAFSHRPGYALFFLMFSGLCDLFDGKVARTKKNRSDFEIKFGVQIDSLTDVLSFGLLPVAIGVGFKIDLIIYFIIGLFFVLFALVRLAYFNSVADINLIENKTSNSYVGLPVTTTSLIIPFVSLFKIVFKELIHFQIFYTIVIFIVSILFVLKINVKKPNKIFTVILIIIGLILGSLLLLQIIKDPNIWITPWLWKLKKVKLLKINQC